MAVIGAALPRHGFAGQHAGSDPCAAAPQTAQTTKNASVRSCSFGIVGDDYSDSSAATAPTWFDMAKEMLSRPFPVGPTAETAADEAARSSQFETYIEALRGKFQDTLARSAQACERGMMPPVTNADITAFLESWHHGGARRVEFHKTWWRALSRVGERQFLGTVFPATVCFYDPETYPGVRGYLALTVDDAPCTVGPEDGRAMIDDVKRVLAEYDAKATFFLCTDFVPGYEQAVVQLLVDGHEVANHCPADRSYADDTEAEFEAALLQAERTCESLRQTARKAACAKTTSTASAEPPSKAPSAKPARRWFRAPQAKLSNGMRKVMSKHGFTHVLTDCYANDPWIHDSQFIVETMLSQAADGSVAVIHMPERGFREYNLEALRGFLEGLRARGMQVVTLSTLHQLAYSQGIVREESPAMAQEMSAERSDGSGSTVLPRDPTEFFDCLSDLDEPANVEPRHTSDEAASTDVSPRPASHGESSESLVRMSWKEEFHKVCVRAATTIRHRAYLDVIFPLSICYYSPELYPGVGHSLALTIDDAPCRQAGVDNCMADDVRKVLAEANAKATFFISTDFVPGHEAAVLALMEDGHEVANHCPEDRSYSDDSEAAFEAELLRAESVCEDLRQRAKLAKSAGGPGKVEADTRAASDMTSLLPQVRWFRAPSAKVSSSMRQVLNRHGFTHVLSDCYANDPWISDPSFIASTMLTHAEPGSVAVLHMPERGFREYNLQALRSFLEGTAAKGLQVVTLSQLHKLAYKDGVVPRPRISEHGSARVQR